MLAKLSVCLLAAVLGQAPTEADWLKVIPGDIDVVVRGRSLEATRADVLAMLKKMSPGLATTAETTLDNQITQLETQYGKLAVQSAFVGLVKVVPGAAPGAPPPFAVLILQDDYPGVLKAVSGGKAVEPKHLDGGVDSFDAPQGDGKWFATKGTGFVAFGPDQDLIAAVAKPKEKTLDKVLTPTNLKPFLAGELGIYVNAAALATRYADQIDAARQAMMAALDQAGERAGNAAAMESARSIYGGLFDSLKFADTLTLGLDTAEKGLHVHSALSVKANSDAAKKIAESATGTGNDIAKLAADSTYGIYMNMSAEMAERFMSMSLRMVSPSGKLSPELEKARATLREQGRIETVGGVTFDHGMRMVSASTSANPEKYIAAMRAIAVAMKDIKVKDGESFVKDVKVETDAATYRGFNFSHVTMTFDFSKLAKGPAEETTIATMKAMYGGDAIHNWYGLAGKQVVQIMAPDWETAKKQLDAFLDGTATVGSTANYKAIRSELPEQASLLAIVNIQGLTKLLAAQISAAAKQPEPKLPSDLPKEPAFIGLSLTPRKPATFELHFVLPSQVGPVIEKGLIPVFQNIQAPAPQ